MKRVLAAVATILCPWVVLGLVLGYDAGVIPTWDLIVLSGATIYAGWWGMATVDNMEE